MQPATHRSGTKWRLCGGFLLAALASATGRAADAPATAPLTARFISPDAVVSLVIRPRQILGRLPDGGEAVSLYAVEAARWSLLQRGAPQHVLRIVEACGRLLHEVEEIGMVGMASGDVAHVIRFARPVDGGLVADLIRRPRSRDVHGVWTLREDDGGYAVALIDDRSLFVGTGPVVDALLDPARAGGPVHDAVAQAPADADMVAAFSNAGLPRESLPPESPLAALQTCSATVRLGVRPEARATATFTDAAEATRGAEELPAMLGGRVMAATEFVDALGRARRGPPADAVAGLSSLAAGLARWAAAVDVEREDARLVVTAIAPEDFEVPADLKPLLVLPDVAAAEASSRAGPEEEEPAEESDTASWVPTHWRCFDAAAALARRKALYANPVAVRLRNRFPAATGFGTATFLAIAGDVTRPSRDLPDQPVSLLAFTGNFFETIGVIPARDRTFRLRSIRPDEVARPFTETLGFGYASLVRIEDVTGVSCVVDGDTARGSVTFESDLAAGEVLYRAVRVRDGWKFTEVDLPGWGLTCTVRPDGTRNLQSDLGPYGGEPEGRIVTIAATLDGEPLRDARLVLYRVPQLDAFDVDRESKAKLPPGRYLVQVLGTELDEALRPDAPTVTVPAEVPPSPLAVELQALRPAGSVAAPAAR